MSQLYAYCDRDIERYRVRKKDKIYIFLLHPTLHFRGNPYLNKGPVFFLKACITSSSQHTRVILIHDRPVLFSFFLTFFLFLITLLRFGAIYFIIRITVPYFPSSVKVLPRYFNFSTCLIHVSAICTSHPGLFMLLSSYT